MTKIVKKTNHDHPAALPNLSLLTYSRGHVDGPRRADDAHSSPLTNSIHGLLCCHAYHELKQEVEQEQITGREVDNASDEGRGFRVFWNWELVVCSSSSVFLHPKFAGILFLRTGGARRDGSEKLQFSGQNFVQLYYRGDCSPW